MSAKKTNIKKTNRNRTPDQTTETEEVPFAAKFRDFVEQIAIAIVLALLFRGFEGEAFVIPTGSMAPTLMGMHKDIKCEKCKYPVRVGAILERPKAGTAICPSCRFANSVDPREKNEISFSGDRIVVNKFAYQFWDPERWDVIVFKYPGNPKQNYIKRLIGLPGETIEVFGGDVFRYEDEFPAILRKPPTKVRRLLQLVHDSKYVAPELVKAGWPAAWASSETGWTVAADQRSFRIDSKSDDVTWLLYRHFPPSDEVWRNIGHSGSIESLAGGGQLISDYCGYNAYRGFNDSTPAIPPTGKHWVGDLAIECEIHVESTTGELWFDLVEAGRHHRCQIDVASGLATVAIDFGQTPFDSGKAPAEKLTGQTKIKGPGEYDVRFANVDSQLILWVNNKVVTWMSGDQTQPAHYSALDDRPVWSETDPGDLNAARIGGKGLAAGMGRLRVLRDVYYVASSSLQGRRDSEYDAYIHVDSIRHVFSNPNTWAQAQLFDLRNAVKFTLDEDQFFPMGDNSPASKDARLWADTISTNVDGEGPLTIEPFVTRERLIGKAFFVYWPHPWQAAAGTRPFLPNIMRMGRIR